jgi:Metallo-beta-lactamase superfamily
MSLGELQQVSQDIYAYLQPDGSWYLNNTGFLVSRDGVISVDATSTERRTRAYLDAIAKVPAKPVRTLVNTHHHGDHTHGNYLFAGATIVGHERCREAILGTPMPPPPGVWTDVGWGHLEPAPPFLTYTDGVTLWSGDLRCEVRYVGTPAHTANDSIIHLACLRFVQRTAREAKAAGLSPLDAARQVDLGEFKDLLDAERIVGNLHRAYLELDGAERGAPIDLARALGDMVAYNGGRPLTCHA